MTALQTIFDELTNENEHTEATVKIAEAVGGVLAGAYLVVLQEINDRHELNGSLDEIIKALEEASK